MMPKSIPIDRALLDQRLLGAALGDAATWSTWMVVLKAGFGLLLDDQELKVFHDIAGDRTPPTKRVSELWCVVGRRGGNTWKPSSSASAHLDRR